MSRAITVSAIILTFAPVLSAQTQADIYEEYRTWLNQQPADIRQSSDILARYGSSLKGRGIPSSVIEERIRLISVQQQRLEAERWNRILTADQPSFNTQPNSFLMEMTRGMPPGRALDVGIGQGRNAIFLAQKGWSVTGFDPAEQAVALARKRAAELGVKIQTHVQSSEAFEWGENQWDLIVATYEPIRAFRSQLMRALKPGGVVVIEAAHHDATKAMNIAASIVFDSNELLHMFSDFRVLQYEDRLTQADFGARNTMSRVVRLCAQKP